MISTEFLIKPFNSISISHTEKPARYYFGEGDPVIVNKCKNVLKSLKKFRNSDFFRGEDAIPKHPLFPLLKKHMDQIKSFYINREDDLYILFLKRLIPYSFFPLRSEILKSISLSSAMVLIHPDDEKFKPPPILSHVDGYYDFIVPVADNAIRIPLIPEDSRTPVSIPMSIRYFTNNKQNETQHEDVLLQTIINQAPEQGRISQLHVFISILARSSPLFGMRQLIADSFTSFDLSFPTALCALCHTESSLKYIAMTLNLLGVDGSFDHFLRSLSCAVRGLVRGAPPGDNPEFVALSNIFLACSSPWACTIKLEEGQNFSDLIKIICNDLQSRNRVPSIALYVLRCALTISAYQDKTGCTALAMFMELVISRIAWKFNMFAEFQEKKSQIIDEGGVEEREIIENTIITILGMKIKVAFSSYRLDSEVHHNDLDDLYQFMLQNADPFVRLVIFLNSRSDMESPALQSILFSYKMGLDYALFDEVGYFPEESKIKLFD